MAVKAYIATPLSPSLAEPGTELPDIGQDYPASAFTNPLRSKSVFVSMTPGGITNYAFIYLHIILTHLPAFYS